MLKIFIVDDERFSRERLKNLLSDIQVDIPNEVISEACDGYDALEQIKKNPLIRQADIIFIDIRMPRIDGMELGEKIKELGLPMSIIFLTAYSRHALQAFDLSATDYLVKPTNEKRLYQALLKVKPSKSSEKNLFSEEKALSVLKVYDKGCLNLIKIEDIIFVKSDSKYLKIKTKSGDYWAQNYSLSQIEEKYPHLFIRIHRNCLAAVIQIIRISKSADFEKKANRMIHFRDTQETAIISRRRWSEVKSKLTLEFEE